MTDLTLPTVHLNGTERDKARAHFGALKTYLEAHLIHLGE